MIKPCFGYQVGEKMLPVLRDAQIEAINAILSAVPAGGKHAEALVDAKQTVLEILTVKPPRKTRSDKGTSKTKRIAPVPPHAA